MLVARESPLISEKSRKKSSRPCPPPARAPDRRTADRRGLEFVAALDDAFRERHLVPMRHARSGFDDPGIARAQLVLQAGKGVLRDS